LAKAKTSNPPVATSSTVETMTLLNGSGLVLTAARALAFVA
jgi:hypothetical protein